MTASVNFSWSSWVRAVCCAILSPALHISSPSGVSSSSSSAYSTYCWAFLTPRCQYLVFVLVALIVFTIRRAVFHPWQLSSFLHGPWDGYIILGLIFLVVLTLGLVEGFRFAIHPVAAWTPGWSPLGATIGPLFSGAGTDTNIFLYRAFWWLHFGIVLYFLTYLPRSKHLHLMATPFNVFFRNYSPKGALPFVENIEEREDYGVSKAEQFTWKQLLDGYACTECGRCNTVCPATNTGKPLFPKEIILGVKEALFVQSNQILGEDTL